MIDDLGTTRCPECGLMLYQPVPECPRCFAPIDTMAAKPVMVERVYEDEIVQKTPKERKDIKRIASIVLIIVVVACLILTLAYYFIIPRIELIIITDYKESSGLVINVDSKVKNEGTLDVQHFTMNITVLDENERVVAKGNYYLADLDPHSSHSFNNTYFYGDQYATYHIMIKIRFESSGKEYSKNFDHTVKEYIYQIFEDKIMSWGG